MGNLQTYPWNTAEHLETKEDIAAYLEAALEDGDPNLVIVALSDIARSKGMTQITRETGLGSEGFEQVFSPKGTPEFATVMKVLQVLGLRFQVIPIV